MPEDVSFTSVTGDCHGWHFRGIGNQFTTEKGRPCVVMAHGFAATKDSGLAEYATRMAAAGVDVLAFDYRGFGGSNGSSNAEVNPVAQQTDYRSAVLFAHSLDGVDSTRVVLWGVSLSAGHVLAVAAADPRIAAVIALTPAFDAVAALKSAVKRAPLGTSRLALAGMRDAAAVLRGRPRIGVAIAGEPGTPAVLSAPGALTGYTVMAGPSSRNEVPARSVLRTAVYRPGRNASAITCPVLVQIADNDLSAPPGPARAAALRCRANVRHYPCDHFDVYPGNTWFEHVVTHQLHFLHRNLAPQSPYAPLEPLVGT